MIRVRASLLKATSYSVCILAIKKVIGIECSSNYFFCMDEKEGTFHSYDSGFDRLNVPFS